MSISRISMTVCVALLLASGAARAEPAQTPPAQLSARAEPDAAEAPVPPPSDADLERQAQEIERAEREAAQKQVGRLDDAQRAAAEREAQREVERKLAVAQEEARAKQAQENQLARDATATRRNWALVMVAGAAVTGGIAMYLASQRSARLDEIRTGGLANGAAIQDAADSAQQNGIAALGFGIVAGALAAVGIPFLLTNLSAREVVVSAAPAPGGGLASLSLRMP